jgi:hypothetical protein
MRVCHSKKVRTVTIPKLDKCGHSEHIVDMESKNYIDIAEKVDLVARIDSWAVKSGEAHASNLYPLDPNAVILDVPTKDTVHGSGVFKTMMNTMLEATTAAAKLSNPVELANILNGITLAEGLGDTELTESTFEFYGDLRKLADQATMHWYVISTYINNKEADFDAWKRLACEYFLNETKPPIDPGEWGFVKKKSFIPIQKQDYDTNPMLWMLSDEKALKAFSPEPYEEVGESLQFFKKNQDKLNMMYRHSVALINYVPWLELWCWYEVDYQHEPRSDFDVEWWRKPKTDKQRYFSRKFRYKYLGESISLNTTCISEVDKAVSKAEESDLLVQEYLPYIQAIVKTRKSSFMDDKEVKEICDWWDGRKKWYASFLVVKNWLNQQMRYIADGDAAKDWTTFNDFGRKDKGFKYPAMLSETKLEEIKADFIISRRVKVDKPEPVNKKQSAYDEYREIMSKLGPRLKEEGWVASLANRNELVHADPSLGKFGMGLSTAAISLPSLKDQKVLAKAMETPIIEVLYKSTLKRKLRRLSQVERLERYNEKWLDQLKMSQDKKDKSRLERMSELDRLLEEYGRTSAFVGWYEVLADLDAQCTRKEIGFQRVKEKSQEAAQRNAGKRFVDGIAKPFPLEPVKHFIELNLKSALRKELKTRIEKSTNDNLRVDRDKILRNFDRSQGRGELELIQKFCGILSDLDYSPGDIDTFVRDALKDVGKKDPTNRTLYDARHVALAFCMDKTMQRKEPRHNAELEDRILQKKRAANHYEAVRMKRDIPYPNIDWDDPRKQGDDAPMSEHPDFPFK